MLELGTTIGLTENWIGSIEVVIMEVSEVEGRDLASSGSVCGYWLGSHLDYRAIGSAK